MSHLKLNTETAALCQTSLVLPSFYHTRSHTGERPYKCVQCSRGFASSGVLKAHIRTHSGLKAYKCLMCDTTFTTSGSLRRHMTTHSDLRPYMCPYCQKTFKSSPNCRKHMKTHRFGLCQCVCSSFCVRLFFCILFAMYLGASDFYLEKVQVKI